MAPRRRATRRQRRTTQRSGKRRSAARARRPSIDVEKLLESMADEVETRLGISILGLTKEQLVEALKPVVEGIVDQYSSRPSKKAILSKLEANAQRLYVLISAYILEKFEKLTPEQLEFVTSYGEAVAAANAPRLYGEAQRLGRQDLIPLLRAAWERFGKPTPIACPRCGFRAVTPDLVCAVCGAELSEKEVKESIDFEERLREMVEVYGLEAAREAAEKGYVVVGEDGVKPPSAPHGPLDVVLHLSRRERDLLKSLLAEKAAAGRSNA